MATLVTIMTVILVLGEGNGFPLGDTIYPGPSEFSDGRSTLSGAKRGNWMASGEIAAFLLPKSIFDNHVLAIGNNFPACKK